MASPSSLIDENNFMCSICLEVFTKPVSLLCGHNFCMACITKHWDTKEPKIPDCPLCGATFPIRPVLHVNTFIKEMVTKFQTSAKHKKQVRAKPRENGGVMCNMCTGENIPALKSCLVCFMSLCETHLEPHQRIPHLKTHKLIEPTDNLEERMCKTHHQPLEMFCRYDQEFVCEECIRTNHRRHQTESIREETESKKAQLDMEKTRMDQWIEERQQKIYEIQESMASSRNKAEKAVSDSDRMISYLVEFLKRSQAELAMVIKSKQMEIEAEAKEFIKEIEEEIEELSKKSNDLDFTMSNDPFKNLENLILLKVPQPKLKDWSAVHIKNENFEVKEALSTLTATTTKEIRMLCDPDLKTLKKFAVDVSFDPETAQASLIVSEDGKEVSWSERRRNVPNNPARFNRIFNVLAKEGFSNGKFYYEVQVKDKTQWDIGVANESINRNGDARFSPRNGFWTIWLRNEQFVANTSPPVSVKVRNNFEKIGVFVDYDKGRVSFYDANARVLIYTFDNCNFTERIFPFFGPCGSDGGKNKAPLVIVPVQN
ncbi:E3 ubiquitin-protein ligase TRIM39-like [Periophthalmus magnuspinnatus]|uniref:E3 ubiquitin-protein ligase TRIM39-like n=1 Tax=Periophthalmus magnuspinnatus TaxID=409849 RepID=UPI00145C0B63|nr:E3 ubiquitin-protein ligase TRIM39-like [Periophthalmus magnuspinnatus]